MGNIKTQGKEKRRRGAFMAVLRAFFSGGQNDGVLFAYDGHIIPLFIYYIV